MQFLYDDGSEAHFMDEETYEQFGLPRAEVAEALAYLPPQLGAEDRPVDCKPAGISSLAPVKPTVQRDRARGAAATRRPSNFWKPADAAKRGACHPGDRVASRGNTVSGAFKTATDTDGACTLASIRYPRGRGKALARSPADSEPDRAAGRPAGGVEGPGRPKVAEATGRCPRRQGQGAPSRHTSA